MTNIRIEVKGIKELTAKMGKFAPTIKKHLAQAGSEAAERIILPTTGLKNYPPAHTGNQPPAPYYIRGRGTQYGNSNDYSSERLGTQWNVKADSLDTKIGNRASYARWVHGEQTQAHAMAGHGWRKLFEVAKEKVNAIRGVYEGWVQQALKDIKLQ